MTNYSSYKNRIKDKCYRAAQVTFLCAAAGIIFILQAQSITAQEYTGEEDFDAIHTQFDLKSNWADDDTKELFKFLYYNIPDQHKQKALKAYEAHFTLEKSSIKRQKLIEVTNAIMDDKNHKDVKERINEAVQEFTSYQDSVKKRR